MRRMLHRYCSCEYSNCRQRALCTDGCGRRERGRRPSELRRSRRRRSHRKYCRSIPDQDGTQHPLFFIFIMVLKCIVKHGTFLKSQKRCWVLGVGYLLACFIFFYFFFIFFVLNQRGCQHLFLFYYIF